MMRIACGALAALLAGAALAQAPAGTAEVTADGCKLYLPQSEAKGASRIRWSGKCTDGLADGRGVVRIYSGGKIGRVSESTFAAGKLAGPGEAYFVRNGEVIRSRGGDNLQIAASELPTFALELAMLVDDRPARAPARPAPVAKADKGSEKAAADKLAAEKAAQETERKRQQAERDRAAAEAKAAVERAAAADKVAKEAERQRLQAEKERASAEAKAAAERAAAPPPSPVAAVAPPAPPQPKPAVAFFTPGRGFAEGAGSAGAPIRGVVTFKLTSDSGQDYGVATFVAGRDPADLSQNAQALAAVYEKQSPLKARLLSAAELGPTCNGPGYVVEARVTYPSAKSYGWYAGCMGEGLEQAAKSMQQLEEQMHRDYKASPTSFWAYQYLIVGYVDDKSFRGRDQYERVAQSNMMAPGRVLVLSSPQHWAECTGVVNKDPKLRDKLGCLREAVDKLKTTLGLR